jgi:hypothetical protein
MWVSFYALCPILFYTKQWEGDTQSSCLGILTVQQQFLFGHVSFYLCLQSIINIVLYVFTGNNIKISK